LFLTSCLEVKQTININKDGSGDARLEVAVQKEWSSELIPKLKSDIPKGWNLLEEKEKEGKQVIVIGRKFKEISELNDDETTYTFSSERRGFLKKFYVLEVKQLKSSDMPFPYEVTIKMPGSIDETSGNKISSNEAKWNLQGLRRGTKLTVKSSAIALPDFASLKEAFNRLFNKVFYREAIFFLRDGNLWVMDSDGENQRQLTKEGVGHWSVSGDGKKIAYKEKDKCYILSLGGRAKKFSDTNDCYSPEISPDGSKVAFIKADEKFSAAEAQQMVSEGSYVQEGDTKKTGVYIFDLKTGEQKRVIGELSANLLHDVWGGITKWVDYSLHWSPDGNRLHFTRDFIPYAEKGGYRDAYIYNLDNGTCEYIGPQGRHILNWSDGKIIYTEEGYSYIFDVAGKKDQTQGLKEFYRRYPTFEYLDWYGGKGLFSAPDHSKWVILIFDTKIDRYKIFDSNMPYGIRGNFSSDGKKIVYGYQGNLWTIDPDGNNKKKIASNLPLSSEKTWFLNTLLWKLDGRKILMGLSEVKGHADETNSIWIINSDGSDLKKLADNASSPKLTAMPRIKFISAGVAKIITLVITAFIGISLLFGMALITRRAVKAVIPRIPKLPKKESKQKGIFCSQCGKENAANANFCTGCGQKLK